MGKRVGIIDEVRGIAVISMVIYHLYFDLVYFYGQDFGKIVDTIFEWWQPLIAGTFIFISGASSLFSRNNFKRGALCFFLGMAFTFATAFITPNAPIYFGVLHFLGIAMMIYGFIGHGTEHIPAVLGIILFAIVFVFTWNVPSGYVGFFGLFKIYLPANLYSAKLLFPLGFPSADFASLDYFPLIPYLFLFFAGASAGQLFKSGRAAKGFYMTRFNGLAWTGRHALIIYILHQPVLIAILELVFKLLGKRTMFL